MDRGSLGEARRAERLDRELRQWLPPPSDHDGLYADVVRVGPERYEQYRYYKRINGFGRSYWDGPYPVSI